MPGPDGTTAAAAVSVAADAVPGTAVSTDPASAPASSTVVSLPPLFNVFLNLIPPLKSARHRESSGARAESKALSTG
ncbi:hypothetical protein GCM10023257_70740 [Streptomyces hyderabadensis]|uniref:Uncharacterized protein n=1 Tax=Streptomyces hyderabadensis TaxID=598549 RepID=A0ABP9IYE0_9ACTN